MEKLRKYIKQFDRAAIALFGDYNSAILLKEGVAAIGNVNVLAITAQSCCMPKRRLHTARQAAKLAGVEHCVLFVEPFLQYESQISNEQMCNKCFKQKMKYILDEAWIRGYKFVLNGACDENALTGMPEEIKYPFIDLKISKQRLSMHYESIKKELPGDGCLFSRIGPKLKITLDMIEKIDFAEEEIRKLGFSLSQLHYTEKGMAIVAPLANIEKIEKQNATIQRIMEKSGFIEGYMVIAAEDFFEN